MNYRNAILVMGLVAASFQGCQAEALSVHVRDAPIRSVLEGLARSENLNLVLDDTVQGTMTINITNVTASEAIKAIVASQNLWYENHGAVQTITAGRKREGAKTFHTWKLQYASPKEAQQAVQAIVPEAYVRYHADTNALVVGATWQEAAAIQSLLHQIDQISQQVDVEVEIASIDKNALKNMGVEWGWSSVQGGPGHEQLFSFTAQIQALEEKGKARILAKPHMVASNGREAHIFIGDKIPVQTEYMSNGEKTTTTEYKDAGIKLTYMPRIHSDGSVTTSIEAEVSTPIFVNELKAYRISTRQAQTVVRMEPEKTLVIGGLISKEEVESFRKVPVLGDIPLLGRLFRSHYTSAKDTEVVILLRAKVLDR